jgi:tetratricopeptide (TPR) repeat protein
MSNEPNPTGGWDRVASELRAYRELQRKAWGETDNALLGRYLADEVDAGERQKVEAALEQHPELRQLTDLVREVLGDCETAQQPDVIPFAPPKVSPKRAAFRPGRRLGWLVAACLLVGVGIPLAAWLATGNRGGHEVGELISKYPPIDQMQAPEKPPAQVADAAPPAQQVALSNTAERREDEYRDLLNQGHAAMAKHRFEVAAQAFNQAAVTLETDGKKADAPAAVAPASGNFQLSQQAAEARQLATYSLNMHNGEAACRAARYDDAVKCYSEALRCQPNDRLANVKVAKAKELAALQAALKPATAVPPQRLEEAVSNVHPFAASLLKGIRKLSEKEFSAKKVQK